jgi:glycosyltransferase involved in cell wall biosynthesis
MYTSIIIPVYNEADILEKNIHKIIKKVERITKSYEIIIAEDGSTDGSDRIAKKLSKINSHIIHSHSDERLGRGLALKRAFKISRGKILVYMDVDLSTNLKHLPELIQKIENGYDFVTGSRLIKGSITKRSIKRKIISRIYNWFCRILFNIKINDLQCGFKAFKRKSLIKILDDVENRHWFFDTEIFVKGSKARLKIGEFPIEWVQKSRRSKVNLLNDIISMGICILKLRFKLFFE